MPGFQPTPINDKIAEFYRLWNRGFLLDQIPTGYNPTDEWLKEHRSGWVEKHENDKVVATLKAHYRVIHSPEHKIIVVHDYYAETTEKDLQKKAKETGFYRAVYKDLFLSELVLLTQSTTYARSLMEIMLHFPNYQSELMFLAWITKVETINELGRTIYHAHLKSVAVNQRTVDKMIHALTQKKA